jgi:hypothetical protein
MKFVFLWATILCTLVESCLCFGEMSCLYLKIIIIIIYLFILVMGPVHCYETLKPRVVVVRVDTSCRIASFCGHLEERVASNFSVTEFGSGGKTFILPFRILDWPQTLQPSYVFRTFSSPSE